MVRKRVISLSAGNCLICFKRVSYVTCECGKMSHPLQTQENTSYVTCKRGQTCHMLLASQGKCVIYCKRGKRCLTCHLLKARENFRLWRENVKRVASADAWCTFRVRRHRISDWNQNLKHHQLTNRIFSNKRRGANWIFLKCGAYSREVLSLFEGGGYLTIGHNRKNSLTVNFLYVPKFYSN